VTYTHVELAALSACVLIAIIATFQIALSLGLPLGDATFGGSAPTVDGVLTPAFRALAVVQAIVLAGVAWIILARADLISSGFVGDRFLVWAAWAIVVFLVLNTIGNFSAPHPVERYIIGATTLVLVILCGLVALRAPIKTGA
jgi:hypothetical protein